MDEAWRPVVGYEGAYEVSDQGRVRSVDRYTPRGDRLMRVRGRLRAIYPHKRGGYPAVSLSRGHKQMKTVYVHSLVAEAFIGPRPDGQEVRHLDGDAQNCRLGNLAYGTSVENKADQKRHGTHHNTVKTHCPSGHPYDDENTYVAPVGGRYCNTCRRERYRRTAA